MTDLTHCNCGCIYEEATCPNCNRKSLEDRIKELTLQLLATSGQAADALDKLAKAGEALRETTQMLSQCTFTIIRMKGQYFDRYEVIDKARTVLAELEGK